MDRVSGARVPGVWFFGGWNMTDFTIQNDTVITGGWKFIPDNEENHVPQTGDNVRSVLLGALLAASAAAIAVLVFLPKKKKT